MNVLFVDDTEQMNRRYVGIGGVIFPDHVIGSLFSAFAYTKEQHGMPLNEEVKWSPRKGSWTHENLVGEQRILAYSAILNLIEVFGGTAIVAVMRRDMTSYDPTKAKWRCVEFVTERFQFFLQAREDENGIMISDVPGSGKDDKKLLSDYYKLLETGTDYVKPSNVVMNVLTTESHLNPGLQLADLVVGITTSMCTPENDYAMGFWHLIKSNLHRSTDDVVMGCGLKVFPKECAEAAYKRLFPEYFQAERYQDYEAYREEMRYLYSQVMTEDELDMHFPRY